MALIALIALRPMHGMGPVKFRQQKNQFGITTDDLRRHMIAIGKSVKNSSAMTRAIKGPFCESERTALCCVDYIDRTQFRVLNPEAPTVAPVVNLMAC